MKENIITRLFWCENVYCTLYSAHSKYVESAPTDDTIEKRVESRKLQALIHMTDNTKKGKRLVSYKL